MLLIIYKNKENCAALLRPANKNYRRLSLITQKAILFRQVSIATAKAQS